MYEWEKLGRPLPHAPPRQTATFTFRFAAASKPAGADWEWEDVEVRPSDTKGHKLCAKRDLEPGLLIPFLGAVVAASDKNADFELAAGLGIYAHGKQNLPAPAVCAVNRCAAAFVNEPGLDERECINTAFLPPLPCEGGSPERRYGGDAFHSPCIFFLVVTRIERGQELLAWYGDNFSDAADGGAQIRSYFAPERYADDDDFARRLDEAISVLAFVHSERGEGGQVYAKMLPPLRAIDVFAINLLTPRDYGYRVKGDCFYEAFAFALIFQNTQVLSAVQLSVPRDDEYARGEDGFAVWQQWTLPLRLLVATRLSSAIRDNGAENTLPGVEPALVPAYLQTVVGFEYADDYTITALLDCFPSVGLAIANEVAGRTNYIIKCARGCIPSAVEYFVPLFLEGNHYKNLPVHVPGRPQPQLVITAGTIQNQSAFETLEQINEFRPDNPTRAIAL